MYELQTDREGRLHGVDKDGSAVRALRGEQLFELGEGADWGFPAGGTAPVSLASSPTPPIWTLHIRGSLGLSWVDDIDRHPELMVGGPATVIHIGLSCDDAGRLRYG